MEDERHKDYKREEERNQDLIEADQNKRMLESYSSKEEGGRYKCNLCLYSSRDKYNMRLHIKGRHSIDLDYRCSRCGKHFKTKVALALHKALSLHKNSVAGKAKKWRGERICTEEACGQTFKQKMCFEDHLRKQHGAPMLKCSYYHECGKAFLSQLGHSAHMRTHNPSKYGIPCDVAGCETMFIHKQLLMNHRRRKHGFPKLQCQICHKEFNTSSCFNRHIKIYQHWSKNSSQPEKPEQHYDTVNYVVEKWDPFMGDNQRYLEVPPEDVLEMMVQKKIRKLTYFAKKREKRISHLSQLENEEKLNVTVNYVMEEWAPFMGDIQRYLEIPPEDVPETMVPKKLRKLSYFVKTLSQLEKLEKQEKLEKLEKQKNTVNYVVEEWVPFMGDIQRCLEIPPEDVLEMMMKNKKIGDSKYLAKTEQESISQLEKLERLEKQNNTVNYVVEEWVPFMGDIQRCLEIPPEDVLEMMMQNKKIKRDSKYFAKTEEKSISDLSEESGISIHHDSHRPFYKGPDGKTYSSLRVVIDKFQGKDKLKQAIMKNGKELCLELGCGKRFSSTNKLRAHKRRKHGAPLLKCQQQGCGQEFCNFTDLCYHMAKGHTS